jgi:hypothetical protein
LQFTAPADGTYQVAVADTSGKSGDRSAAYRLAVEKVDLGFTLSAPDILSAPLDGNVTLAVQAVRRGTWNEPIVIAFAGLPAGVTAPADAAIPLGKNDAKIELSCAADAASTASLVTITGTAKSGDRTLTHSAGPMLLAAVMKPRCSVTPEGLDDVRTWPRGSTYPGPVLISRLEGYTGEVTLEMSAKQERHRQGVCGPEIVVPPGVERIDYPVYLPEWLETTKTSRIVVNSVTKVADPKGHVRYLVNRMKLRIGFLPKGALLKLAHQGSDFTAQAGQPFEIPLTITRDRSLVEAVKLELRLDDQLSGALTAEPVTLAAGQTQAAFRIQPAAGRRLSGEREITIRATAMQKGVLPVISETDIVVDFASEK